MLTAHRMCRLSSRSRAPLFVLVLALGWPLGCGQAVVEVTPNGDEGPTSTADALCTVERDVLLSSHPICNDYGSIQFGTDGELHAAWSTTHQSAAAEAGGVHQGHYAVGLGDAWQVLESAYGEPVGRVSLGGAPEHFAVVDYLVDLEPRVFSGPNMEEELMLASEIDREGQRWRPSRTPHGVISDGRGTSFLLARIEAPDDDDALDELALIELSGGGAQIRRSGWDPELKPIDLALRPDGRPVWLAQRFGTWLQEETGEALELSSGERLLTSPRAIATDAVDRVYVLTADVEGRELLLVRTPDGTQLERPLPSSVVSSCAESPTVGDRCTTRTTRYEDPFLVQGEHPLLIARRMDWDGTSVWTCPLDPNSFESCAWEGEIILRERLVVGDLTGEGPVELSEIAGDSELSMRTGPEPGPKVMAALRGPSHAVHLLVSDHRSSLDEGVGSEGRCDVRYMELSCP